MIKSLIAITLLTLSFTANAFNLSEASKRHREGVDQRLIDISDLAIKISPVDFGHPRSAGIRTAKEQHELYKKGVSKADGYISPSHHQSGRALDFYAYVDGKASWDPKYLTAVAVAFMKAAELLGHRIQWGGNFKTFRDLPHIQLAPEEYELRRGLHKPRMAKR